MHLVVGLGNPGRKYEQTRHNVGFVVVDRLGARVGATVERKQLGALVDSGRIEGQAVVFAKPQSFMNLSGQPVASLKGYYKATNDSIVVVHDDVDLPFGQVRVKVGGGHGGHNGLRDLNRAIGADYVRVRFGVGRPPAGWDTADYVLGRFTTAEAETLDSAVDRAADAVQAVVVSGSTAAMNVFNTRSERSRASRSTPTDPSASSAEG